MHSVYLIKNQSEQFLSKNGEWIPPDSPNSLFQTRHKDEAVNQKVEIIVKQPDLRIEVITAECDDKGSPTLKQTTVNNSAFERESDVTEELEVTEELIVDV